MQNIRVRQGLMALGWLLITGLTICAVVRDMDGLTAMTISPWTLPGSTLLILTDLIVELTLISIFIYFDSKRRGKNPWGWIVAALLLGGMSTLGYLLLRSTDKDAPPIFGR